MELARIVKLFYKEARAKTAQSRRRLLKLYTEHDDDLPSVIPITMVLEQGKQKGEKK